MEQEAANELGRLQRHGLLAIVIPVVAPAEADLPLVDIHQAVVGDRDPMGVPTEVLEDLRRSAEWGVRIDHPLGLPEGRQVLLEDGRVSEGHERAIAVEPATRERRLQGLEEQPPEQPREDADGQEEPGAAGDPVLAVGGNASAGTTQWRWGCKLRVCPHVCRTARNPSSAPRCCGSAAMVRKVSAVVRKRIP